VSQYGTVWEIEEVHPFLPNVGSSGICRPFTVDYGLISKRNCGNWIPQLDSAIETPLPPFFLLIFGFMGQIEKAERVGWSQ
jgi:hypothetical protein